MCFSAAASFTAAIVLTTISIILCTQTHMRRIRVLAYSPFMFGLQQACEGFVWLSFTQPAWQWIQPFAAFSFLFFALAWWPFWIPFALTFIEPRTMQRKTLIKLLVFGIFFSSCMILYLYFYETSASATCNHIFYSIHIPQKTKPFVGALYLIPTIVPFFISSIWGMNMLGTVLFLSCLFSYISYSMHFISVWCFFAAILSGLVAVIIRHEKKAQQ